MRPQELGSRRIVGLDIIRSAAILAVMLSHFLQQIFYNYGLISAISNILGVFGVELFFVLSGYLIGGIIIRDMEAGSFEIKDVVLFWKRRWFRTIPNYYLFLIVNIIMFSLINHKTVPDLYKFFFFWQGLMNFRSEFYGVSWSLCVEEWAYLLLPILCIVFLQIVRQKKQAIFYTIATFILIPLIFRIYEVYRISNFDASFTKGTFYRIDSIFFGVGLSYLDRYQQKIFIIISKIKLLLFYGMGLIAITVIYIIYIIKNASLNMHGSTPGSFLSSTGMNVFYFNILDFTLVSIVGFFSTIRSTNEIIRRIFTFISTYSYSLYLCHINAMVLSTTIFGILFKYNKFTNVLLLMIHFIVSFAIAIPIYHLFEKRITSLRERIK